MTRAAVLTISDSRSAGSAEDKSGPAASEIIQRLGFDVVSQQIIPDDAASIRRHVRELIGKVSLIVTTGGTGIAPRDVTFEAVAPLLTKELPGFGEIMRTGTFAKTPLSIISRGGAGIVEQTLIVMLPGSPRAVTDCLELLGPAIKHVLKVLGGAPVDCQKDSSTL